jgi:uncharacterized protein (TIGR02118 family)
MLKFIVVIYKRPDLTQEQFRQHLQGTHATLAKNLPGLRRYVQNHICADPKRKAPGWDAVVELYFDDSTSMEAAWASPQGVASDADLPAFADLTRTTWSVVDEVIVVK